MEVGIWKLQLQTHTTVVALCVNSVYIINQGEKGACLSLSSTFVLQKYFAASQYIFHEAHNDPWSQGIFCASRYLYNTFDSEVQLSLAN